MTIGVSKDECLFDAAGGERCTYRGVCGERQPDGTLCLGMQEAASARTEWNHPAPDEALGLGG